MSQLHQLLTILDELRRRVFRVLVVLIAIFGFLITFEINTTRVRGIPFRVPYPYPSPFANVTAQVYNWLRTTELPRGVVLLNIGVGDAVIAQMEVGLVLTVAIGMPWIAHEAGAFLMPALRLDERRLLKQVAIPATILFLIGFTVALFWITPFTYLLLFKYVGALGLAQTLEVTSFVEFTLLYSLGFGLVFELPVFVYGLTRIGLVKAHFWRQHWRAAVLGCLIFGMIITPDNSGVTMLLIAIPMMGLYGAGVLFASRFERRNLARSNASLKGGVA